MTSLPDRFFEKPFAHRALHGVGRPENSLSAVKAAINAGYGIELDLQLSADGQVMVFHDSTLDRMTEAQGAVAAWRAADLAALSLTGGAEECMPTLAAVLETVSGDVPLLFEVKDQDGSLGPGVGCLERAISAALAQYSGPAAVMSFNPHSVALLADLMPHVPRGLTTCAFDPSDWPDVPAPRRAAHRSMWLLDHVNADFISHDVRHLEMAEVAQTKARGLPVACWTIRSPEAQKAALQHADCVTFEGYLP